MFWVGLAGATPRVTLYLPCPLSPGTPRPDSCCPRPPHTDRSPGVNASISPSWTLLRLMSPDADPLSTRPCVAAYTSPQIHAWRTQVAFERARVQAAQPTSRCSVLQVRDTTPHTHRPSPRTAENKEIRCIVRVIHSTQHLIRPHPPPSSHIHELDDAGQLRRTEHSKNTRQSFGQAITVPTQHTPVLAPPFTPARS